LRFSAKLRKWLCHGKLEKYRSQHRYQYDPAAYRKSSVQKISKEVCNDILKKLYPEESIP